ncbi:MAG TPA: carboxypeptidase-like regulatory domain-containing protein [bacterium]
MVNRRAAMSMGAVLALAALVAAGCAQKQDSGQATFKGRALTPLAEAHVSVYREGMDLKGPAFVTSQPTGPEGEFSLALPPGKYFFVLRHRVAGESVGPVRTGDYRSEVIGPVTVRGGETFTRDLVALRKIGETKDLPSTTPAPTSTGISGVITDSDGTPVKDARVHAYTYPQMSERPKYVSEATGADGRYVLFFPEGGTFYLAARNRFGGPPKIGELYGRYDDGAVEPSAIHVKDNQIIEHVDITVHKVW